MYFDQGTFDKGKPASACHPAYHAAATLVVVSTPLPITEGAKDTASKKREAAKTMIGRRTLKAGGEQNRILVGLTVS